MKVARHCLVGLQRRGCVVPPASTPTPTGTYGVAPLVQSQERTRKHMSEVSSVGVSAAVGTEVTLRGRVDNVRATKHIIFLVLRQQTCTVQCIIRKEDAETMRWVAGLAPESIVDVVGTVVAPSKPVSGCTVHGHEVVVSGLQLVSPSKAVLPFQLSDAASAGCANVLQSTRLDNRWLDMRTPANNAIWKLQSRVCQYFREFLQRRDFTEIHTPKIIPAASESGATVFKLGYVGGRDAFLAQSPQLYKQMALMGDLQRVFEVGPVFRAENSNTHRHLCEFTGLDVEMAITEHYGEVLEVAEALLSHIFSSLQRNCTVELDAVQAQFPHTPFVHVMSEDTLDTLCVGIEGERDSADEYKASVASRTLPSLRLSYPEGIRFLNTALPDNEQLSADEDLTTEAEKTLGRMVKERYGVDFYILDRYPLSVRPFYTMPHPENPKLSNSYDMFMRGEEISSGAQRVHDAALLVRRCEEKGADKEELQHYLSSFELGAWPHGGFGLGLERVVMLFLGMDNIRSVSMFPRDPKRNTP